MIWFELGINILESFAAIMFLTLYLGIKYEGCLKYICVPVGVTVATFTISILNNTFINEGVFGMIMMLIYFLYARIFCRGDKYNQIFIAGLTDSIIFISNAVAMLISCLVLNRSYVEMLEFSGERVISIIINKIVMILFFIILLKLRLKIDARGKNITALIILTLVTEFSLSIIMSIVAEYEQLTNKMFEIMGSCIAAVIVAYYIFIQMGYDAQIKNEYMNIRKKYESDQNHIRELKDMYEKVYGLRHDLSIHFNNILNIKDDPQKIENYVNTVIDKQLYDIKDTAKTDNKCLNAILDAKISVCKKYGIYVSADIMSHSLDSFTDDEIGIIFGNLFDNAIKASKNSLKKSIELDVGKKGQLLSIVMMNSVDNSVMKNNENLHTTKTDKTRHGFGIKNIKRIVAEHNGIIDFFEENGYFICQILMDIKK